MRVLFIVVMLLSILVVVTLNRNRAFIEFVQDSVTIQSDNASLQEELSSEPRSYLFVEKGIKKFKRLMEKREDEQLKREINALLDQMQHIPIKERDIIYLGVYLNLFESLLKPYKALNLNIAFDKSLLNSVFENEKRFYSKLIEALRLPQDLKELSIQRIYLYLDRVKRGFLKGGKVENLNALLAEDMENIQRKKIVVVLIQEMMKTLRLEHYFETTDANKIKASYIIALTLPGYGGLVERYQTFESKTPKVFPGYGNLAIRYYKIANLY
jgi:hypothetical protein